MNNIIKLLNPRALKITLLGFVVSALAITLISYLLFFVFVAVLGDSFAIGPGGNFKDWDIFDIIFLPLLSLISFLVTLFVFRTIYKKINKQDNNFIVLATSFVLFQVSIYFLPSYIVFTGPLEIISVFKIFILVYSFDFVTILETFPLIGFIVGVVTSFLKSKK